MTVQEITVSQADCLDDMAQVWPRLTERAHNDCVFLRYEWFDAAWQWAQAAAEPLFLSAQLQGETVGILPLMQTSQRRRGLQVRRLEFLSIPDTQVCDVICSAELKEIVLQAFARHLAETSQRWDVFEFVKIPDTSNTAVILQHAFAALAIRCETIPDSPNHAIDLGGSWQEYYSRRSRRLKKGNNLIANKMNKSGERIDLEWLSGDVLREQTVQDAIAGVVSVSARSWKRDTRLTLENPLPNAFLQRITRHAVQNNWLSLCMLRCSGQPIAFEYQLMYRGNIYALRADYDQAFDALSPGSYLNWKLLERMFDSNLLRYHLGQGNNPYKERWAELSLAHTRVTAFSSNAKSRAIALLELDLLPQAKRLLRGTRHPSPPHK